MKKFSILTLLVVLLGLSAFALADAWNKQNIGGNGGRLSGFKCAVGLENSPGQSGCVTVNRLLAKDCVNGEVVIMSAAFKVTGTALASAQGWTKWQVAGVVVVPPGASSQTIKYGNVADVAVFGDVVCLAEAQAITAGDVLMTSSGTASGYVCETTTVNVSALGNFYMQALETKTTTAADPYIRCRIK
jgi:hypothetical protein